MNANPLDRLTRRLGDRGTLCVVAFCENLPLDAAERAIGLIAREALAAAGIASFDADRVS